MKKILSSMFSFFAIMLVSAVALAETHEGGGMSTNAIYAISAALAIAIAGSIGAISQAKAAATALEGISRNPGAANKVQTPMIIALALIESLVIYALVIAFLIQGKIA